ncbi:universal stress protein UspE [Candidatus Photodesmus blepharus]|uniref:universal stress protein UspE n=1 Tax=Candidatus Photodesmus blepharonis TaxID=1179155 RepID=UPI000695E39C|nr:universal stress protein UspE [Candidatus Photodesmus blepharus]
MENCDKLLVIADVNRNEQLAFARAAEMVIRSKTTSSVTFFLCVYDFSYEMLSILSRDEHEKIRRQIIHQREKWMHKTAKPYFNENFKLNIKVVWHNKPHEAILREVFLGSHSIVIKSTQKHETLQSIIFTPTDHALLLGCPAPLLFVKSRDWPQNASILGSINPETNADINFYHYTMEQLHNFTKQFNLTPYIINFYSVSDSNSNTRLSKLNPKAYSNFSCKFHFISIETTRKKRNDSVKQRIIEEGLPEIVIPTAAKKLNAAMLIIGMNQTTSYSTNFGENNIENIIKKTDCDILILKSERYTALNENN